MPSHLGTIDSSPPTGSPDYFKPALNTAHEIFDGELVVVNLESGRYYAMRREAADIFQLCLQEASVAEITQCLAEAYLADPGRISDASQKFLASLVQEGLLTRSATRPDRPAPSLGRRGPDSGPIPFAEPEFEAHNDMQDLLMLDPIHEVDAAGWPVIKPQQS